VLENGFSPQLGEFLFTMVQFDNGVTCTGCHTLPAGTDQRFVSGQFLAEPLSLKNPQLRTLYEKGGFDKDSLASNRGFGFTHDGSFESIVEFLEKPVFNFAAGQQGDEDRRHLEAFLLSFSTDTHAGIGVQATIGSGGLGPAALRDEMIAVAEESAEVALIVKGRVAGEPRGYYYDEASGLFPSDRSGEVVGLTDLDAAAGSGSEITYTLVPQGAEVRLGVDRDEDGSYDRDELDACSNPADASIIPGGVNPVCCEFICGTDPACCASGWDQVCQDQADALCGDLCPADVNGDLEVDVLDLIQIIVSWGPCPKPPGECPTDITGDGVTDVQDLVEIIVSWGECTLDG
jgi:hypothetical protein